MPSGATPRSSRGATCCTVASAWVASARPTGEARRVARRGVGRRRRRRGPGPRGTLRTRAGVAGDGAAERLEETRVVRRTRAVAVAVIGCLTVALALITVNAPSSPPNRTPLATGPGWRVDGVSSIDNGTAVAAGGGGDERAWLAAGAVPGRGTRWASMVRFAMVDLRQLARSNGAVAAGAAARWGYAWPRDMAFVAVAMA